MQPLMLHHSKLIIFYANLRDDHDTLRPWYQRQWGGHNCSWAGGIQTLLFYEQATGPKVTVRVNLFELTLKKLRYMELFIINFYFVNNTAS